ncbi:hypothetical protein LTSEMIS_0929 [Salmonella enterica subsp. enterica serovar Mississippi str. A4-633]|nr:hypothetical protein LTSEMIS_0929 [Salmonella enterica subsp. enterica serovar Mississippi str. A4-633]
MVATTGFASVEKSATTELRSHLFSRYLIGVAGRIMRIEP